MSSARFWHFWFGIAFLVGYILLNPAARRQKRVLHPLCLVVIVPVLYLGTALSDWDIWLWGIGGHRNPLFHSAIPYFLLALVGRLVLGLTPDKPNLLGRLVTAVHVGFALGLASHLVLDIVQYGDVRWISGGKLDRLWLGGNAVVLSVVPWVLSEAPDTPTARRGAA